MPILEVRLDSLDNSMSEQIKITGSKMEDFTTVRRPTVRENTKNTKTNKKYEHARDKQFYMTVTANEETTPSGKQRERMYVYRSTSPYCGRS